MLPAFLVKTLIVLACAMLNRLRGDDRWMEPLPGRTLWYVSPVIGALALAVAPWPVALAWVSAYLGWGVWAWGRWYDLHHMMTLPRSPTPFEHLIERMAGGSDHLALFIRHLLILPGFILLALATGTAWLPLLTPIFAAIVVLCYDAAWRVHPANPIMIAECLTGAIFGLMIITI